MVIWFLDCTNGCTTRVNVSKEREDEINRYLDEEGNDMYDYISLHEDEFGISLSNSSFMVSENDEVYDVEF